VTSASGANPTAVSSPTDRDIAGNEVPTYRPHAFTYDNSGNISTETVTDGTSTWVRTYTYVQGQLAADSGWVKQ